jgi:hypothetical protein
MQNHGGKVDGIRHQTTRTAAVQSNIAMIKPMDNVFS